MMIFNRHYEGGLIVGFTDSLAMAMAAIMELAMYSPLEAFLIIVTDFVT